MRRHRKILVAALIIAVIAAVAYGLKDKPVRVETASVARGPLKVTVDEDGWTRVKDRYTVTAPVAGYLTRIPLKEGDAVAAGQVLARLEPLRPGSLDAREQAVRAAGAEAAGAAYRAAAGEAEAASAKAEYAASNRTRTEELFKKGIVSEDELEKARTDDDNARAALESARYAAESARHELESAKAALGYTGEGPDGGGRSVDVHSPVSGRVFRVLKESEGTVAASEPLVEIGNTSAIEVVVDLLSADAVKVGPGTRVIFERWGGSAPLEGMVRVVDPSGYMKVSALGVEEQRVDVISDITSPPESYAGLGDGYRVDASFIVWESGSVLTVPESALFRKDGGWSVFTVVDGKAALRPVGLGHRNGVQAEALSGLSEGDVVIVHPGRDVGDGVKVKPWDGTDAE